MPDQDTNENVATLQDVIDPNLLVKMVSLLKDLPSPARIRLVDASLMMLGTSRTGFDDASKSTLRHPGNNSQFSMDSAAGVDAALPRRAQIWVSQNGIDQLELDSSFHRTPSGVDLIAHQLPSSTNKDRVRHCYLLVGVRSLLSSGEPKFTDDDARAICRELGCYDRANHATYVKAIGNLMVGSKSVGYELTQPGLRAAAELIKSMRRTGAA